MSFVKLRLLNTSGETAPPFAIAEVADAVPVTDAVESGTADADSVLEIRKPTGSGRVCAVGPAGIADDRYGKGLTGDCFVRFTGDDPSPGDVLKATAGSWAVSASGTGTGVTVAGDIRTIGSGETAYKVVRVEIGGGSGGGTTTTPGILYESLPGQYVNDDGEITSGGTGRILPLKAGTTPGALTADLDAEFIDAELWDLATFTAGTESCCSGGGDSVPTGPRITYPVGEGGINRVAVGDTAAGSVVFSGTGAVPGESLTLSIQAINPTTGALTGSALTPTVTNNADGTWDAASQSLATLTRGLCRVMITNGSTRHAALFLWSDDEWEAGESNMTGDVYWSDKADLPDLQAASDTGESAADNITDDTTPDIKVTLSGTEFIGLKDDMLPLLYLVAQSDGDVFVVAGSAGDYSSVNFKVLTPSALAVDTYVVHAVNYLTFTNTGYTYDEWWSPPSNQLRVQIVADASAVPAKRYAHLCWYTVYNGRTFAAPGRCRREITEAEANKLDGV